MAAAARVSQSSFSHPAGGMRGGSSLSPLRTTGGHRGEWEGSQRPVAVRPEKKGKLKKLER